MSGMGTAHGYINRMYPNKPYSQYGSTFRSGIGFGSNGYDMRTNGLRGQGNGYFGSVNDIMDSFNELNRGPKNQKGVTPVSAATEGQNISSNGTKDEEKEKEYIVPDREQYNREDFPVDFDDAKFFVIKSYSEDDVHKSKYNVWASTPNGNKKLDAAYQEANQKSAHCPTFLFFSVNTSGQFVGLAEMVGPVDFQKNVEFWQQDKWTGCFPLNWHIVKDVPNNSLKHITLENNENKPVTNSRDTQEIKLEQGHKLLKIFKEHSSKTCILDDFEFYEVRQKAIQETKAKHQLQKQVWEGKLPA
ncbi:YTH domain-containing protein ECT2-like [Hibiscus syriacus]|uniref:YTH domain-containing protein ECT2-like n=1 Tax=Hibiscus syriacus TaxID=106335 RepID=UPI0019248F7C|nr:YTH domain-containing protein ECT2-like [Hibiscus syriacus]